MMSYELKANITTIIATYLIPLLVGYGVSYETANALVGVLVTLILLVFTMLNERYTSTHLTKEEEDSVTDGSDFEGA